jgi:hypothetical protein
MTPEPRPLNPLPLVPVTVWLVCLLTVFSGCTWQGYAVTRGIRTVTGIRTDLHAITPVTAPLRPYRIIEMHPLENLVPAMPSELERYLNDALAEQLHLLPSSPAIVRRDPEAALEDSGDVEADAAPTLVLDGFIDDYDPGYVGLRLVELGLNHQVVTVRIQLRDKQTGDIVGAASVTAQDNRVVGTLKATIGRLAARLRTFVERGYGG